MMEKKTYKAPQCVVEELDTTDVMLVSSAETHTFDNADDYFA